MSDFLCGKRLLFFSEIYLLIPVIIFFIGYLRPVFSIPLALLLVTGAFFSIKDAESDAGKVNLFSKKTVIVLAIILLWTLLSGIGGFVWQNRWDHMFRNALFEDLVNYDWPVINSYVGLCYYFGFWLPSAVIGKLFGMNAGYIFQVIWAFAGISLTMGMIFRYFNKVKISFVFIFIFFSGLDIFVWLFTNMNDLNSIMMRVISGEHIELLLYLFNSSSNTTLLFWVYNQCIPFWLGFILILKQKSTKNLLFILSLMAICCPIPCVGLAPLIAYRIIKELIKSKNVRQVMTVQNVIAIPTALIMLLFFRTNNSAGKLSILPLDSKEVWIKFAIYLLTEFLCYLIILFRYNRHDIELKILFVTNCILPFLTIGKDYDFAWRTCIPLSFYLTLLVIKGLHFDHLSKRAKQCLVVMLCLGAFTPVNELMRTVYTEYAIVSGQLNEENRSNDLQTIFDEDVNECYSNFTASTDNYFYLHLAKTNYDS